MHVIVERGINIMHGQPPLNDRVHIQLLLVDKVHGIAQAATA